MWFVSTGGAGVRGRALDRRHRGGGGEGVSGGTDYRHKEKEEGEFEFVLKWELKRRIGVRVGDGAKCPKKQQKFSLGSH